MEILGFIVGILYLWWEYHANPKVWLASVVMPAISMWIYFSKGLYADFAINIYYLAIAVYGYWRWTSGSHRSDDDKSGKQQKGNGSGIMHTPIRMWPILTLAALAIWGAIWWILVTFTDSTVPVADAFTTALSIVALWMMARKFAEEWLVWLVVDLVCSMLYWYKGLPLYCILYAIYTVIAWFGYRKWLRLMKSSGSGAESGE